MWPDWDLLQQQSVSAAASGRSRFKKIKNKKSRKSLWNQHRRTWAGQTGHRPSRPVPSLSTASPWCRSGVASAAGTSAPSRCDSPRSSPSGPRRSAAAAPSAAPGGRTPPAAPPRPGGSRSSGPPGWWPCGGSPEEEEAGEEGEGEGPPPQEEEEDGEEEEEDDSRSLDRGRSRSRRPAACWSAADRTAGSAGWWSGRSEAWRSGRTRTPGCSGARHSGKMNRVRVSWVWWLKTPSHENRVFRAFHMFLWHFSCVRGHISRKGSAKLHFWVFLPSNCCEPMADANWQFQGDWSWRVTAPGEGTSATSSRPALHLAQRWKAWQLGVAVKV